MHFERGEPTVGVFHVCDIGFGDNKIKHLHLLATFIQRSSGSTDEERSHQKVRIADPSHPRMKRPISAKGLLINNLTARNTRLRGFARVQASWNRREDPHLTLDIDTQPRRKNQHHHKSTLVCTPQYGFFPLLLDSS
jgi:hypothetical protein